MDGIETTVGQGAAGGGGGRGGWIAALVQAVLAGVGSVYLSTKSIPITLVAVIAAVIVVALVIRSR